MKYFVGHVKEGFWAILATASIVSLAYPVQAQTLAVDRSNGFVRYNVGGGFGFQQQIADVKTSSSYNRLDVEIGAGIGDREGTPPNQYDVQGTLLGAGYASYGILGGVVTASARGVTPGNLPVGYGQVHGYIQTSFQDIGVVMSKTLPLGTLVDLNFPISLDSTGYLTGATQHDFGAGFVNGIGASFTVTLIDYSTSQTYTAFMTDQGIGIPLLTVHTFVGATLELNGRLDVDVDALAGPQFGTTDVLAGMDALHTAKMSLTGPDDIYLAAASGTDYHAIGLSDSAATPEPATLPLLVGALLPAVITLRKRRGNLTDVRGSDRVWEIR